MPASVCAGVGLLWHQSAKVVVPQLIWFSAPTKLAIWMSDGWNKVAKPACIFLKYSITVQLAATPRKPVCHVCMWALTKPGMTMVPLASTTWASSAWMCGAMAAMRSPSISTSPWGKSPIVGSIDTMVPPRMSVLVMFGSPDEIAGRITS